MINIMPIFQQKWKVTPNDRYVILNNTLGVLTHCKHIAWGDLQGSRSMDWMRFYPTRTLSRQWEFLDHCWHLQNRIIKIYRYNQKCTVILFAEILLSEALVRNSLKGQSETDHQSFDYIINQLAKVTRFWKIMKDQSFDEFSKPKNLSNT